MDSPVRTYPAPGTLDDVLGFEMLEASPEGCRARFAVEKRVQQPLGLVHGGAYAALAESMVSATTHMAVEGDGNFAVGQSNNTHFHAPGHRGRDPRRGHARSTAGAPAGSGTCASRTTTTASARARG